MPFAKNFVYLHRYWYKTEIMAQIKTPTKEEFYKRKRIPYGMMNFVDVREDLCYYVDKTRFIEKIEAANKYFFFIRPRRFGKSLTKSMLQHYYDIRDAKNFERWYGDLYIGKHPTPERNSYLVINLNFSMIDGALGNYKDSLDIHCNTEFNFFCDIYEQYLPKGTKEEMNKRPDAVAQLDYLYKECYKNDLSIYLFIDEYDHFTNTILAEPDHIEDYMSETHGTGYLRRFFNTIKSGTDFSIKRVFVTGVSPVTMDDLTSGFNIGTNYSLDYRFNEMVGFTEQEVRDMLTYYSTTCHFSHSVDELISIMKPWYDNYCFAKEAYGETTMYNSNMVLYFVDRYVNNRCQIPDKMVEDNIRIDYNKLRMLIRKDKEFANDASAIQALVTKGFITGDLQTGFPAEKICSPNNFVSLLYYFGMITIDGTYMGKTKFVIPNEVVREQIFTYLLDTYKENDLDFESYDKGNLEGPLAYEGDWKPYFQYIADTIYHFSSQRDKQKGEAFVHGFTLAMTSQCQFYRPISELDNQGGYADIFLMPLLDIYTDMLHSYVVELKYVKSNATDEEVSIKRNEAEAQVCKYADSDVVKEAVKTTQLHRLVVIYRGVEMVVCEEI